MDEQYFVISTDEGQVSCELMDKATLLNQIKDPDKGGRYEVGEFATDLSGFRQASDLAAGGVGCIKHIVIKGCIVKPWPVKVVEHCDID